MTVDAPACFHFIPGKITAEYRERMYALCDLYARPYDRQEPVVCLDEKSSHAELLVAEVAAWQRRRNHEHHGIRWGFTRQDADRKLGRHYVT